MNETQQINAIWHYGEGHYKGYTETCEQKDRLLKLGCQLSNKYFGTTAWDVLIPSELLGQAKKILRPFERIK